MATPTTFFGLQKAAEGENYDLDHTNLNLDAIDLGLVKINSVNSTYNVNSIFGTASKFTRVRIGATNVGFVIAEFNLDLNSVGGVVIAANTAAPTSLPNLIPAGYRPKDVPHSIPLYGNAPVTNAGVGISLMWGYNTDGDVLLRSTGAAYTTVNGSDMQFNTVYEWGGN
jgi:hypothetical protein